MAIGLLLACGNLVETPDGAGSSGATSTLTGDEPPSPSDPGTLSTTIDASTSMGSSGVGDSASSGEPTPCGNGVVDPGEACDDGNDVDDDGCRDDCTLGFALEYELRFDGDVVGDFVLRDDELWLVGGANTGGGPLAPTAWHLTPDGVASTWAYAATNPMGGQFNSAVALPSGDVIATGSVTYSGSVPLGILVRFNPDQEQPVWVDVRPESDGLSEGARVVLDGDGVVWAGHDSLGTALFDFDVFVERINLDGHLQWTRRFNAGLMSLDQVQGLAIDAQRDVHLAMSTDSEEQGPQPWLMKMDANGTLVLNVLLDEGLTPRDLEIDEDGNLVVGGTDERGLWIERHSPSELDLVRRETVAGERLLGALLPDGHGGTWVAGSAMGEIWMGLVTHNGEVPWSESSRGNANDEDLGVAVVRFGDSIVFAGSESIPNGGVEVWVRSYGPIP